MNKREEFSYLLALRDEADEDREYETSEWLSEKLLTLFCSMTDEDSDWAGAITEPRQLGRQKPLGEPKEGDFGYWIQVPHTLTKLSDE